MCGRGKDHVIIMLVINMLSLIYRDVEWVAVYMGMELRKREN